MCQLVKRNEDHNLESQVFLAQNEQNKDNLVDEKPLC